MNQGTKQLGELLKARREGLNISLKEAENATSIRVSYLTSIEEGRPEKLISPVYAEGFVKQYATFLGLDGDKILSEYPHLFKKESDHQFDYGIGTLEMRGNPGSSVKWMPNKWVIGVISLLLVGWYVAYLFDYL
jgi:cytoskeletal protein RodZ